METLNVPAPVAPARDLQGVATRLRLARESGGLSQQEFADRVGYTRRQVIAWEGASATPPIWAIAAVRRLCGIDPEWVLTGPGLVPLSKVPEVKADRMPRLRKDVLRMARDAGMELPPGSVENVALLIAQETPEAEREAKKRVRGMLRALSSGKTAS
jgi:transcriptional regulator with XRE-family HTH domain